MDDLYESILDRLLESLPKVGPPNLFPSRVELVVELWVDLVCSCGGDGEGVQLFGVWDDDGGT